MSILNNILIQFNKIPKDRFDIKFIKDLESIINKIISINNKSLSENLFVGVITNNAKSIISNLIELFKEPRQPQYRQQTGRPQYGQPQYGQQTGRPQYGQPQYGQQTRRPQQQNQQPVKEDIKIGNPKCNEFLNYTIPEGIKNCDRKTYLKESIKVHPDKHNQSECKVDAEEAFKRLNNAWVCY